ncbi:MAG: hypothetical protein WCS96_09850 [Victivallales bacterium]
MSKMKIILLASLVFLQGLCVFSQATVTERGIALSKTLDSMHVDRKWLSSAENIDWRTGDIKNSPPSANPREKDKKHSPTSKKTHTHCSSFVASVCENLGIYILRPPEHSAVMLSNAQYIWLLEIGPSKNWTQVFLPTEAQELANQGNVVVAVWKNPDPENPGHIVVVRPCEKSDSLIFADGPDIIQAGKKNYNCTTLREGFKNHKGAFENSEILFFSHPVPEETQ